jgi:hypothetical protein
MTPRQKADDITRYKSLEYVEMPGRYCLFL